MRNTTKRFSILAATLILAGTAGACADEPMGPDEQAYEVQMDGTGTGDNCVWVGEQLICS